LVDWTFRKVDLFVVLPVFVCFRVSEKSRPHKVRNIPKYGTLTRENNLKKKQRGMLQEIQVNPSKSNNMSISGHFEPI
jgi:hypothetical protein